VTFFNGENKSAKHEKEWEDNMTERKVDRVALLKVNCLNNAKEVPPKII
jgi:hypothetical protein